VRIFFLLLPQNPPEICHSSEKPKKNKIKSKKKTKLWSTIIEFVLRDLFAGSIELFWSGPNLVEWILIAPRGAPTFA